MNSIWKIWLTPNLMTEDAEHDYIGEVSTVGETLRNEDIAQAIKDEGSELHYETLLDIINRSDRIRREKLHEGRSVQTGVCRLTPRVTGNWISPGQPFDPAKHQITVNALPTAELRASLSKNVKVEILGVKTNGGACIGLVTDVATGRTDGHVSRNGNIIITGYKIKVVPEDEAGLGVFFVSADGTETPCPTPAVNNSRRIITYVPALPDGDYTLKIVTRYTNSAKLLNHPRIITYAFPLTLS